MLRLRSCGLLAASLSLVGCSVHPLPRDVTRDTTLKIVNKIRCEARDALVQQIKHVLGKKGDLSDREFAKNQAVLRKILAGNDGPEFFCGLLPSQLAEPTLTKIKRFAENSVTYAFKFDITENKVKKGTLGFSMPFTKGSFGLSVGAGANKKRQNVRQFEVSDTFSGLVLAHTSSGKSLSCDEFTTPRIQSRRHWIYPITGRIGLAEVFDTYIKFEKTSALTTSLSDKLTFTTVVDASANPSVNLSGIPQKSFRLASASVDYSGKRTDLHEVKLTLIRPAPEKVSAFSPIADAGNIVGMPPGLTLGFTVKRNKPYSAPATSAAIGGCSILGPSAPAAARKRAMRATSPFLISKEAEEAAISAGIAESRRLDALDTSQQLKELIGK